MARSATDYLRLLQSLLPRGRAWRFKSGSSFTQFLQASADELARIDARSFDLLNEADPRITDELLTDWEKEYDLPDDCFLADKSITERRQDIFSKLITVGQQYRQYFIDIAAALGYTITITEFTPFWMAIGAMGDSIGEQTNLFWWRINIIDSGSSSGAFNNEFGKGFNVFDLSFDNLECLFNKLKPAHTRLLFDLVGPEFNKAFDFSFDSLPSDEIGSLEGAFGRGFGQGFDVANGGAFSKDDFGEGFNRPN